MPILAKAFNDPSLPCILTEATKDSQLHHNDVKAKTSPARFCMARIPTTSTVERPCLDATNKKEVSCIGKRNSLIFPQRTANRHMTEFDIQKVFSQSLTLSNTSNSEHETDCFKQKYFSSSIQLQYSFKHLARCGGWKSLRRLLNRIFPVIRQIRSYRVAEYFPGDLIAGISTGVSSVPMGMSYSLLAGLDCAHGLYCNIFFPLTYMFLGTAKLNVLGTSAIEALICQEAVSKVVGMDASLDVRLNASIGLCFCVSIIMFAMRFLNFAMLAGFLADPVLSGFSSGSAIVIGTSQLHHLLGIESISGSAAEIWLHLITQGAHINWISFSIGVLGLVLLFSIRLIKYQWIKHMGPLIVIGLSTLFGYLWADYYNLSVVGIIPRGFPKFGFPKLTHKLFGRLLIQALWYSIIFFGIHISLAKSMALRKKCKVDAEQELFALGVLSFVGSFFQCFPRQQMISTTATSLSRTSIASSSGANTILFNIGTSALFVAIFSGRNVLIVILTITVFTPLLRYLPMTSLAAIILSGVYWLINFKEPFKLLRLRNPDILLWMVSFNVTLFLGPFEGLVLSLLCSLLWLLKKNARPNTAVLARLPASTVYRSIHRFPTAQELPGIKIFRFDASLNFSNADYFQSKILSLLQLDKESGMAKDVSVTENRSNLVDDTNRKAQEPKTDDLQLSTISLTDDCLMATKLSRIPVTHNDEEKGENSLIVMTRNDNDDQHQSTVSLSLEMCPLDVITVKNSNCSLTQKRSSSDLMSFKRQELIENLKAHSYHSDFDYSTEVPIDDEQYKLDAIYKKLDKANSNNMQIHQAKRSSDSSIRVLIVDASSINDLDITSVRMIKELSTRVQQSGRELLFANWKGPMRDFLYRAKFYEIVSLEQCFLSLHDAVVFAEAIVSLGHEQILDGASKDIEEFMAYKKC